MYLPLTFETHKCNLIFLDPNVGEMQYEVIGVPKMPQTQQTFKFQKNIDELTSLELSIPPKNMIFASACGKLIERLKENNDKELIPYVDQLQSNTDSTYSIDIMPSNFFVTPE